MSNARLLILFCLLLISACATNGEEQQSTKPTPGPNEDPTVTLKRFRESIENEEWKYVHLLMSKRSRKCYSQSEIEEFLSKTKPGILERFRLMYWNVKDRKRTRDRVQLKLVHPSHTDYVQWYPFVLENGIWRLDWSLADLFHIPREVEDCGE